MNTSLHTKQKKQPTRQKQKYNTPILEEHGDLHKLTHGGLTGTASDPGNPAIYNYRGY